MTKIQQQVEHIVVTAAEAALAYLVAVPHVTVNKALLAGAAGAALSAVYNVLRQSTPSIVDTTPQAQSYGSGLYPGTVTTLESTTPAVVSPNVSLSQPNNELAADVPPTTPPETPAA